MSAIKKEQGTEADKTIGPDDAALIFRHDRVLVMILPEHENGEAMPPQAILATAFASLLSEPSEMECAKALIARHAARLEKQQASFEA